MNLIWVNGVCDCNGWVMAVESFNEVMEVVKFMSPGANDVIEVSEKE